MNGILDRVAKSHAPLTPAQFRPATPQQFFALRLAGRLHDAAAVQHYVELCNQHTESQLIIAHRKTIQSSARDLAQTFHRQLARLGKSGNGLSETDLAAIRIERRAVAVAIFRGRSLKYPPIARQLSSEPNKALGSAASFINRLRDKCSFSSAALELLHGGCEVHRSQLTRIVLDVLGQRQVAIQQFEKHEVVAAFGHPPLRFRKQAREVISAMWPEVNGGFGSPLIKDALALGLYCQVEQALSSEN